MTQSVFLSVYRNTKSPKVYVSDRKTIAAESGKKLGPGPG